MWMNLLTDTLPEGGIDASIGEAVLYALMGYMVVFAGIAFLIAVVWLVGKLMSQTGGIKLKREKGTNDKKEEPSAVVSLQSEESEELSEETIAVIMAALTAYYETNNPKCEFTIKRIKKVRRNDYA